MSWDLGGVGFDWATGFDDAKALMLANPSEALQLNGHRDFRAAVPTPDHFIPLLCLAGLADGAADQIDILADGYAYGSLSMPSYTLGLANSDATDTEQSTAPPPPDVPADESNI